MKHYIAGHEAHDATDFVELAVGTPVALWLGEDGETEQEREARLDAARDILADDPALADRTLRLAVDTIATMPDLLRLASAIAFPAARRPRRTTGLGVAA